MCNNYKVTVSSQGDGWRDEKFAEGQYSFDGVCSRLIYKLDGDDCVMTYDGKTVTQTRSGGNNLRLTFCKGRPTACAISLNGAEGFFDIFTEELKALRDNNLFKLYLEYFSGSDREKIKLTLTAEKIGG